MVGISGVDNSIVQRLEKRDVLLVVGGAGAGGYSDNIDYDDSGDDVLVAQALTCEDEKDEKPAYERGQARDGKVAQALNVFGGVGRDPAPSQAAASRHAE